MPNCILDPQNLLPSIEWETREKFLELGKLFCRKTGGWFIFRVRSGRRTCAEQRAIFQQGRTTPGEVVTHADGCQSWHVMGRAVDADIVDSTTLRGASEAQYRVAGELWEAIGGVWGGGFPGFPDIGHFEFHPGLKISDVCPIPSACSDGAVDTVGPGFGLWLVAGVVVTGALAYAFSNELAAGVRRISG